ncbi:MAG: glycosyltransferase family 4 protein [Pseudomonadota bacterium]|nr:glycosyltransferase family 4 protein [Pseudomonadota bacterium]
MNRTSDRIKVLHVITRFDKGGSAENTFLTVSGLDPRRYETFLIAGGGAQDPPPPPGSGSSAPRRRATPAKRPLENDLSFHGVVDPGSRSNLNTRDSRLHGNDEGGLRNSRLWGNDEGGLRNSRSCGIDEGEHSRQIPQGLATGSRCRGFSEGASTDVDPESAAAEDNYQALRVSGVKTFIVSELVRRVDPLRDLRAFFRVRRIIRRLGPHIVHTHTSKAGIIGRLAALSARVPIVVHTPHGHIFWGYFGTVVSRFFICLETIAARSTDRLIMLTEQEKADHLHHRIAPPDKFVVIHSGVRLEAFSVPGGDEGHPEDKPPAFPPGAFVIGAVGRLTAIKGQRYLLTAAAELAREIPELICLIVGEGEMRRELEEEAAVLGMGGRVVFPGWRRDVGAYISALDVFVMPSLNEGMGRVVVEAMASGRPVVASDVGGLRNLVIQGQNGLLVPPGDAAALAAAIRMLYRDPARRRAMGEEGRRRAPAFSAGAMIEKIDDLYRELLRERHVC